MSLQMMLLNRLYNFKFQPSLTTKMIFFLLVKT